MVFQVRFYRIAVLIVIVFSDVCFVLLIEFFNILQEVFYFVQFGRINAWVFKIQIELDLIAFKVDVDIVIFFLILQGYLSEMRECIICHEYSFYFLLQRIAAAPIYEFH